MTSAELKRRTQTYNAIAALYRAAVTIREAEIEVTPIGNTIYRLNALQRLEFGAALDQARDAIEQG